jgi:hypothetical protein
MIRIVQVLLGVSAALAIGMGLFIPFPPPNGWEQSALLRLAVFAILALTALILLSIKPRVGRLLTTIVGLVAFAQLVVVVAGLRRAPFPMSSFEVAVAISPWLLPVLALVMVIRAVPRTETMQRDA